MDKEAVKQAVVEALEEFEARKMKREKEAKMAASREAVREYDENKPLRTRALQWALFTGALTAVVVGWLVPWPAPMGSMLNRVAMALFIGMMVGGIAYNVVLGVMEWRRDGADDAPHGEQ